MSFYVEMMATLKIKCEFMNKYEFMHNADFEVTLGVFP